MAYPANLAALRRCLCYRHRLITSMWPQSSSDNSSNSISLNSIFLHHFYQSFTGKQGMSTHSERATQPDLGGVTAYDILGVSQNSSSAEIKASFHKLAKETHPDLAHSHNHSSDDASKNFIQILTAYEILSDFNKRAHYDSHLLSQRTFTETHTKRHTIVYDYYSNGRRPANQMEVVEWLKWYRYTINDILSERRVTSGTGYFDELERDFYSAVHAAFYGPEIDSVDLLPDRFEAEERSVNITSEVLQLVSGRDLFGMVCIPKKNLELSNLDKERLASSARFAESDGRKFQANATESNCCESDAYNDLEFHLSGRIVAVAKRFPPKDDDSEDQIHVYLTSDDDDSSVGCINTVGVIKGLGTSPEEGNCYVYNNMGIQTHMIMKHRTLLVKHLHWYRIGEKFSLCECRGTRARLPPSKYWLFEPRCPMHDVGGWYIETFGRDRKGKTVPAQRHWNCSDTNEHIDERLHPAVYLFGLAYRTLDIEKSRREKRTIKDRVEAKISRLMSWYKKVV